MWAPEPSDLKHYRHFDHHLRIEEILPYVSNADRVKQHPFMPFLHFELSWRRAPVEKNGSLITREPKVRKIRYACRKDAYIFKYYREILSAKYEQRLQAENISGCVLAYRRVPKRAGSSKNKSNIEFAKEAFENVAILGKCCAVAIDISDFFGTMSHERIKSVWADLLGEEKLPEDHFAVFKALTKFRWVDRNEAFLALGFSEYDAEGKLRFKIDPAKIPTQLCSNKQYREKIVSQGLVRPHKDSFGIPQGAPLSDLIANAYLLEFDKKMQKFAEARGGKYYRYSDDILFLLPGDGRTAKAAYRLASRTITQMGAQLKIKAEKTEITCFKPNFEGQSCYNLAFNESGALIKRKGHDGLSYLGFRYDGHNVFLRNSTISNLTGKMYRSCQAIALNHVDRYPDKDLDWLLDNAPLEQLAVRFFQVENFDEVVSNSRAAGSLAFKKMTFFTYARRAIEEFGDDGKNIAKQTARVKRQLHGMLSKQIVAKYQTREARLIFRQAKSKKKSA